MRKVAPAKFKKVTSGYKTSFAVDDKGTIWSWGHGSWGLYMDGDTKARTVVDPVPISKNFSYETVAATYYNACAIESSGKLYCWGSRFSSRLGDGNAGTSELQVTSKDGPLLIADSAISLAVGPEFRCQQLEDHEAETPPLLGLCISGSAFRSLGEAIGPIACEKADRHDDSQADEKVQIERKKRHPGSCIQKKAAGQTVGLIPNFLGCQRPPRPNPNEMVSFAGFESHSHGKGQNTKTPGHERNVLVPSGIKRDHKHMGVEVEKEDGDPACDPVDSRLIGNFLGSRQTQGDELEKACDPEINAGQEPYHAATAPVIRLALKIEMDGNLIREMGPGYDIGGAHDHERDNQQNPRQVLLHHVCLL